jgi:hypothetical protein
MRFRHDFRNEKGETFQVILPAENRPPWRQPGEVAEAYVANHEFYGQHGPWTLTMTDRAA